jgi:uncharacterized membrane protein YphA (DoxX/SURF4 family)
MSKPKLIAYWITTILLALMLLSGGAAELARQPATIAGMTRLGYPPYFASILGFWKILGAIAILAPRLPRAKEWAYAGIVFDLTGAASSHAFSNDLGPGAFHIIVPLILAAFAVTSWSLRPPKRRLAAATSL